MNKKALIPLVAGLGVGGFALKMVFDTLQKARGAQVATITVLAARDDIPNGTKIVEEMLKEISYPSNLVPTGSFQTKDREKILGRVPRISAPANLPILEDMLLPPGATQGLFVKPGFRAVAVRIDESSGVNYMLQPGCHVDVIGYFTATSSDRPQTIARTVIENVEVAAVGSHLSADAKSKDEDKQPARAAILFVEPEKVPLLHLAEQSGKIKLSMRNTAESTTDAHLANANFGDITGRSEDSGKGAGLIGALIGKFMQKQPAARAEFSKPGDAHKPTAAAPQRTWDVIVWNAAKMNVARFESANSPRRVFGEPAPGGPTAPANNPPKAAPAPAVPETTDAPKPEMNNDPTPPPAKDEPGQAPADSNEDTNTDPEPKERPE